MSLPKFSKALHYFISQGALFVINHSGGKDSQAMSALIRKHVPADQIIVVHAHLEGVEWDGVREHIRATTEGLEYFEVRAEKTFLGMVEKRGMFPSSATRQCTSDLKRDPIDKLIRRLCKERGYKLVINCMGLRAQESPGRAKKSPFRLNKRQSKEGRLIYNWLPIHAWDISEVWSAIEDEGQKPHWAYAAGMSRLSCCFCIMASKEDLRIAAALRPELFAQYVALEKKIGFTMMQPKKKEGPVYLEDFIGVKAIQ